MRDAALRAITDAQTAARKARAAKLLCSAFARWASQSVGGAFVFWRGVSRTAFLIEDARTRAARLFGLALQRWALKSQACAFVCWRSTTSELLLIDDRRRRAAALFHRLGCGSKQFFCCPVDEPDGGDPHVLASQMLSPASVDAIADAAILFVRAHLGRGHGLERRRSGAELRRGASYGPFGSFTGLDGLTRPFPF